MVCQESISFKAVMFFYNWCNTYGNAKDPAPSKTHNLLLILYLYFYVSF